MPARSALSRNRWLLETSSRSSSIRVAAVIVDPPCLPGCGSLWRSSGRAGRNAAERFDLAKGNRTSRMGHGARNTRDDFADRSSFEMAARSATSRRQRWHRLGVNVRYHTKSAREDRQRRDRALDLSLLRRRLRPTHLPQRWQTDLNRRRSRVADQPGQSLPQGRGFISAAHPFATRNESEIPRSARKTVERDFARSRDGPGGGPRVGIAQAHLHSASERIDDQSYDRDLPPRRRDTR